MLYWPRLRNTRLNDMDYEPTAFERTQALEIVALTLPAATYNLSRILLAASKSRCVFVPIRSMQYLAVVDQEEIIFVDSQYKRWVEIAWRHFQPQTRAALDAPVPYQAVFYTPDGQSTQRRLQSDFHAALSLLASRRPTGSAAPVLAFPGRGQAPGK